MPQRPLQSMVALLYVTVLVGTLGLSFVTLQTIVIQQRLVALRKLLQMIRLLYRSGESIRAVQLRHTPQLPERILQSLAQGFKTL